MSASASVDSLPLTGERPRSAGAGTGAGVLHAVAVPLIWGGALVLMALGAGSVVAAEAVAGRVGGFAVVTLGLALFLWAALSLSAGQMIAARAGVASSLAGIGATVILLALQPAHTSIVAVGAATLLLAAGASCTLAASRRGNGRAQLRVWALVAAAAVVAVVATPALGSVQDAVLSSADGTLVSVPAHEGH